MAQFWLPTLFLLPLDVARYFHRDGEEGHAWGKKLGYSEKNMCPSQQEPAEENQ